MSSNARISSVILLTLVAVVSCGGQVVSAQPDDDEDSPIRLTDRVVHINVDQSLDPIEIEEGKSIIIEHEHLIEAVDGFDPNYLAVSSMSPTRLRVISNGGATQQSVVFRDLLENKITIKINVTSHNLGRLSEYLDKLFPEAELELYEFQGSVLIRGTVPLGDQLTEVYEVAEQFFPNVLKHAKVEGTQATAANTKFNIPPGMRVVTARMDDPQNYAKMLAPGDRVDVLVTFPDQREKVKVATLLEYVSVFATGKVSGHGRMKHFSLVVTPDQAAAVQLAEKKGELSLVWRNKKDDVQAHVGGIDTNLIETLQNLPDQGAAVEMSPPREEETTSEAGQPDDLQSEIRELHTDVKRLIELLEQRQAGQKRPVEEFAVPQGGFPKPATSSREPEVSKPLDVKRSSGPAGTFSGRIRLVGDVPRLEPLVTAENLSERARKCTDEDIPDESLLVGTNGELTNVFVFPAQLPEDIDFSPYYPSPTPFTSRACRFVPHCSIVRAGQTVLLKNDDPIMCNVHTSPLRNAAVNQAIAPNEARGVEISYERTEPTITRIYDDLYPWKSAYQLVVDHNFATLTNDEGYFEVRDLPPGEYRFVFWHEKLGHLHANFPITIKPDEGVAVEITKDAEPASQPSKPEFFGVENAF